MVVAITRPGERAVSVPPGARLISRTATMSPGIHVAGEHRGRRVGRRAPSPLPSRRNWRVIALCPAFHAGAADLGRRIVGVGPNAQANADEAITIMRSSAPRPSIRSLPPPPRRMSPSPQTSGPVTSGRTRGDRVTTVASGVFSGGTIASRPAIGQTRRSNMSHPMNPRHPRRSARGRLPRILSSKFQPDSASTSSNCPHTRPSACRAVRSEVEVKVLSLRRPVRTPSRSPRFQ